MGFSHNRSRKETQRRLDTEDPERRQVRNLIRRGKAPRITIAQVANNKIPTRGTYRHPDTKKRAFVLRMNSFLRFTSGVIFSNKASNAK